jgi:DNA recombination protein RmuC
MPVDPLWYAVGLSGLAALLALAGLLRSRGTPGEAAILAGLDDVQRDVAALQAFVADDIRRARDETAQRAREQRGELSESMRTLGDGLDGTMARLGAMQTDKLEALVTAIRGLGDGLGRNLEHGAAGQKERLDGVAGEIRRLAQHSAAAQESLRAAVEGRLDTLRQDNAEKLEAMRRTVDEKLQGTLEKRLGESFKLVSGQLEQVFKSVGEMQTLAHGVGDLKRVLTNVKSRGTWAEVSLGAVLDQVLTNEQYRRNIEVRHGSGERVEYAVLMPGEGDGVLLPIDAKFPSEDYERLLDASDRADTAGIEAALKALETRIRAEGQTICAKYIHPPATTDFAILYLPTEGLYAEIIRRPGLVDHLQSRCRIVVAGPTVLLAILNSLRMGFRTLAIQQRSSEVWQTLSAVKTEFGRYGEVLDRVRRKLGEASKTIDDVAVRRRAIDRHLAEVESLPDTETNRLFRLAAEHPGSPRDGRDHPHEAAE